MTARADDVGVWKMLIGVSAASLALATSSGGALAAPGIGGLPAGWTHAEINVAVNHVPHTIVLDRGRVTTASASSLTLREQDGSTVQVDLSPTTQVTVNGQPGQLTDLRRGAWALTQRIDGGAATRVVETVPPRLLRRA